MQTSQRRFSRFLGVCFVNAFAADAAAGLVVVQRCQIGRPHDDPRRLAVVLRAREELRGLQPPLAVANFAVIDDVARPQRQAVEHDALLGVRKLAARCGR